MARIVRIEAVTKTFPGGIVAVDDMSLEVEDGRCSPFLDNYIHEGEAG